eukprot:1338773-Prymnesium_polylepis.1
MRSCSSLRRTAATKLCSCASLSTALTPWKSSPRSARPRRQQTAAGGHEASLVLSPAAPRHVAGETDTARRPRTKQCATQERAQQAGHSRTRSYGSFRPCASARAAAGDPENLPLISGPAQIVDRLRCSS